MLTLDVGFGVELSRAAGIETPHPFFGLSNSLKSRSIVERKVSSVDFDRDRIVFETKEHDTITQPGETGVVVALSLSAAPFHSASMNLASELGSFVKRPDGLMASLSVKPQAGTAALSGLFCIELRGEGDGKLGIVSFDPFPSLSPGVEAAWFTSFRRFEWLALNNANNCVSDAYRSMFDTPDEQIRPTVRAANRKAREVADFPELPFELPGLRKSTAPPTKGIWTVVILVDGGTLSHSCKSRIVALHNTIAIEHDEHVGVVVREDSDSYRATMTQLSDRVGVVHADQDLAEKDVEQLIVELEPFVAHGVAVSNSPAVVGAMNSFPFDDDDDSDMCDGLVAGYGDADEVSDAASRTTFTSPFDSDDTDLTFRAYFIGETPIIMEVVGDASAELNRAMFSLPAFLSVHTAHSTTMKLEKVVRDATIIQFLKDGPSAFHSAVKTELSKVIFKRGRPGQFGAIRLEQKDAAMLIDSSPAFVSSFFTSTSVD